MDLGSWYGDKEESEILLVAKTNLLQQEQKDQLKKMGQAKKFTRADMMGDKGFSRQGFCVFI